MFNDRNRRTAVSSTCSSACCCRSVTRCVGCGLLTLCLFALTLIRVILGGGVSQTPSDDFQLRDHPAPIRIICVVMASRLGYMHRQLAGLDGFEFNVTLLPAVVSWSDPRVAGWGSEAAYGGIGAGGGTAYYCSLSHFVALGIVAAENSSQPTVILEDDIMLHRQFPTIVRGLLKSPGISHILPLQLGFGIKDEQQTTFDRMVTQESIVVCRDRSRNWQLFMNTSDVPCPDEQEEFGKNVFRVGRTGDHFPQGTVAYLTSSIHASAVWASRFSIDPDIPMENGIFRMPQPFRIVPPLAIDDHER
jgi:hypothetical protein